MQPLHVDDWLIAMVGGFLAVAIPVAAYYAVRSISRDRAAAGVAETQALTADAGASHPPHTRYAWLSILTAVATVALKAGAFLLTGSVALLADAAESLVNLVAAGFVLMSLKIAARPADENHPHDHGKAEYFSSGFEGALILVAAAGILYAAWDRLQHPQPLEALDVGILVAVVAAGINLAMARTLLRAGRQYGSITLEADGHHLMTDVWTTGAILIGLGGIAMAGWTWLDSATALLAGLNIVNSGVQLIRRSLTGLLGAVLPAEERQVIESILAGYRRQGIQFHDLRSRMAGTHRLVTFHVLVPGTMAIHAAHELLDRIEAEIQEQLPNLLIVTHVEPLDDPAAFRHETLG